MRQLSLLVAGDLGFHTCGFLVEASLFLSDVARLWVFLTSRGQPGKRCSWDTCMVRGEGW